MNPLLSLALFVMGLGLVIFFAEKLVKGAVGTSQRLGISTFLISVIFISFDPENLGVGAVAAYEGVSGIALGSILGAAMVAIALAFGITAFFAPMEFRQTPPQTMTVPLLAVVLLGVLSLDGLLSRLDGVLLLIGFVIALLFLVKLSQWGLDIEPKGEVAETLEKAESTRGWKSVGLLLLSLAGIILGSELLVTGSETMIAELGLSDTVFGMTILALLVSIEELARELPAARRGRPEISYGNVSGSILAFFLFNAGIIALVRPVQVDEQTLTFYLPLCLITLVVISFFMLRKKVGRWAGAILVMLYAVFFVGGYLL